MKIAVEMDALGFRLDETGGGCTAYVKDREDGGVWMITTTDGLTAPNNLMCRVLFGVHDAEGVELSCKEYPNLRQLINAFKLLNILKEV